MIDDFARAANNFVLSRADIAPHTPYVSRVESAWSPQSVTTGQSRQIRLACSSRARLPIRPASSGKKTSGGNRRQLPHIRQVCSGEGVVTSETAKAATE